MPSIHCAGLPCWSAVLVCRAGDGDDVASGPSDVTVIYAPSNPEDQGMSYLDLMRGQTPIANPQRSGRRRAPEKRVAGKLQFSAAHFFGHRPPGAPRAPRSGSRARRRFLSRAACERKPRGRRAGPRWLARSAQKLCALGARWRPKTWPPPRSCRRLPCALS